MKIRKMLLLAALSVVAFSTASAQETERVEFNHHWFLQFQGGATYTLGETDFSDLISPAAQVAVGYQFTPVWALRLAVNGWESKGGFPTSLNLEKKNFKWNYITPAVDVKFNLINAISGYNPKRWFGLNIIAGVGCNLGFNMEHNADLAASWPDYPMSHYWDGEPDPSIVGRAGLDVDFRLCKRLSLNIEAMSNFLNDHYNGKHTDNVDWYFTGLVGLKVNLGKVENVIPVAAPVVEPEPEPAPVVVKETPKPAPVVTKAPEMKTEIFYAIRETVAQGAEAEKVQNLIAFLKNNPNTKVSVTSYADAGTGNPKINEMYARKRAENVAKALIEGGIDESRITVGSKGDTVQPFTENDKNRVSIAIAK